MAFVQSLNEALVIKGCCLHWEEGHVKLKTQLSKSESSKKNLTRAVAEMTRE